MSVGEPRYTPSPEEIAEQCEKYKADYLERKAKTKYIPRQDRPGGIREFVIDEPESMESE